HDVAEVDARAELDVQGGALLLDPRGHELLPTKPSLDSRLVVGLHRALTQLAATGACLPDEFGHVEQRLSAGGHLGKELGAPIEPNIPIDPNKPRWLGGRLEHVRKTRGEN